MHSCYFSHSAADSYIANHELLICRPVIGDRSRVGVIESLLTCLLEQGSMAVWISVVLAATVLWVLYTWRKRKFSYFKDMGIPGPEPSLIFGNLMEIKRRGGATMFAEWIKKYGNIVGFYNGAIPFLLVNDLELLKKVEIEDFHNFAERGNVIEVQAVPDIRQRLIVTAPVNRWREMRAVLSPAFTTRKLSQIFVIMDECTDTMIELLHQKAAAGEAVEVSKAFRRATMDTMFKAGYGVNLDVQHSTPGGPLDQMGDGAGALLRRVPLQGISFLSNCFPELHHFWFLLTWVTSRAVVPYFTLTTKLIQPVMSERRAKALREKADVLQLLLNKESTGELFKNDGHGFDGKTKLALTREEVIANSAFYLIAGLEATPNTMGLTLHLLALHPEIQDRLQAEISEVLQKDGKFTSKNVMEMPYMDMVLNESMRFYTGVVGFVTRRAESDFEFKGTKIPKGLSVMVPVTYLHHDPEVWHEPEKFDPERFNPENKSQIHPVSFQPFGKGPRECLGKNFALVEMKLMLSKFLANFRVIVDEEHHKEPIKLSSAFITTVVNDGIWLKLEKMQRDPSTGSMRKARTAALEARINA
ncbi:cytochrome P450 3A11-like [Dermacentor variabilis]|uniref:cytochrome P450 3A11-like n=1 Tax=Dermacentor variabilis TaxID=34621 RepID=UPI003F5AE91B